MNIYNSWTPSFDDTNFNEEKESLLDYITEYYNPSL